MKKKNDCQRLIQVHEEATNNPIKHQPARRLIQLQHISPFRRPLLIILVYRKTLFTTFNLSLRKFLAQRQ